MWQQCVHKIMQRCQELQLVFTSNIIMGEKHDLREFDYGMVFGARWADLNILEIC